MLVRRGVDVSTWQFADLVLRWGCSGHGVHGSDRCGSGERRCTCILWGGERRRLGTAWALIADSEILLLHERFAGLEAGRAEGTKAKLVCGLRERRRAIVFTSHEVSTGWVCIPVRHEWWPANLW